MASRHWHKRLLQELHRQGLPSVYADRLVEELTDHVTDLFRENLGMDAEQIVEARMGTPEQLAAVAKHEFRRRTFAGRHPLLTFIAGPMITVIGTFIASCFTVVAVMWLIELAAGDGQAANEAVKAPPSALEMGVIQCASFVMRFLPFVVSAWVFIRLGRRSGQREWSMVACGIVTVAAVCFTSVVSPATAQGEGSWALGFHWKIGFDQIMQAVVPLALGAGMLWQSSRSELRELAAQ